MTCQSIARRLPTSVSSAGISALSMRLSRANQLPRQCESLATKVNMHALSAIAGCMRPRLPQQLRSVRRSPFATLESMRSRPCVRWLRLPPATFACSPMKTAHTKPRTSLTMPLPGLCAQSMWRRSAQEGERGRATSISSGISPRRMNSLGAPRSLSILRA